MKIVLARPGKPAFVTEIDNSVEIYRRIVEGTPQEAHYFADDPTVVLICNEEGKLLNLSNNRMIADDVIAGTFFLCNYDSSTSNYCSLTDDQAQKYVDLLNDSSTCIQTHYEQEIAAYTVGGVIPQMCIHRDGCIVELIGNMLNIYVLILNPTSLHIQKANTVDNGLKLSASTHEKVLCIAVKPGALPWHDTPFYPQLCSNMVTQSLPLGYGLTTNYFLVNSANGKICELRSFALSNKFSNYVLKELQSILENPFDEAEYAKNIDVVQKKYSSKDLGEKFGEVSFRLHGK